MQRYQRVRSFIRPAGQSVSAGITTTTVQQTMSNGTVIPTGSTVATDSNGITTITDPYGTVIYTSATPSGLQNFNTVLTTLAWVTFGGLGIYFAWPLIMGLRGGTEYAVEKISSAGRRSGLRSSPGRRPSPRPHDDEYEPYGF